MNKRFKRHFVGKPISLSTKIVGKIDLRVGLILLITGLVVIHLVFFADYLPFVLRATIALMLIVVAVTLALVPFRGTTFERSLLERLPEKMGAKQFLHQTAEQMKRKPVKQLEAPKAQPKQSKPDDDGRGRDFDGSGVLVLDSPLFGVLVFVFITLLTIAGLLIYSGKAGPIGVISGFGSR